MKTNKKNITDILNINNMDKTNQDLYNTLYNTIDNNTDDNNINNLDSKINESSSGKSSPRKHKTSDHEAQRRATKRYYEKNKADVFKNRNNNYYNSNIEDTKLL